MRFLLAPAAAITALAAFAPTAASQLAPPLPIELGVDAAISTDDVTDATTIQVPLQRLRVGFFVSPRLSVEPALAFIRASGDGGSATSFTGDVGLLAHLAGVPTGRARTPSLFVRPFVGLTRASFDFDDDTDGSTTRANAGVGLGVKLPVADRLAWRLEGVYTRAFKSDEFPAANAFALNVGLSFHTR